MRRLSLRWLLLIAVLGTMTVAFAGFAVYIDGVERDSRIADIDDELLRAERTGPTGPAVDGPGPAPEVGAPPNDLDVVAPPVQLLITADGELVDSGAINPFDPATLEQLVASEGIRTTSEPNYRVMTSRTPDGVVVVTALPLDEFDAAVSRFRTALAAGGAVLLLLVAGVLWLLTGFLTRPVARMAHTANEIASGDLNAAVGPPSGSRETAELSVDLDRMLARLREALDDATRSRDAMERFLADMAHEIRTPLTALKGYSDLYAKGMLVDTSDVDRAMARIGSESERLTELANAMLQLASEGTEGHQTDVFDLAEVAGEVASDLRAAYPRQEIELRVDGTTSTTVNGSSARLHQAILNLGANACHHNTPGAPIEMVVESLGGDVAVKVVDHGPGIDPADIDQIFLPFFRSDTARSRDGHHGAGLGLALTKQIVDRHHGTVTVEPTPSGGATFVLRVPHA